MPAFAAQIANDITHWLGTPDCQAAHNDLIAQLTAFTGGKFNSPTELLCDRQKGNLGEFISFHIASSYQFGPQFERYAQNALKPLARSSATGLDLIYIYFDNANSNNDIIYVQEIKTTFDASLSYADRLTTDYAKLFGSNLNLTLQSRLQFIANTLEFERNKPHLCNRVLALGQLAPNLCNQARLIPTLVHEKQGTQPNQKLTGVRHAIAAQGWDLSWISPWSISFDGFAGRLERIARGQP